MLVLALLALLPPSVISQPSTPLLNSWLDAAVAHSPALDELRARLDAANARRDPASLPPDPMIEAMLQDIDFPRNTVGREDMSMIGVELRQEFTGSRRLNARGAAATAERDTVEADVHRALSELEAQIRIEYATLYALDSEDETITASSELLEMLAATATARYSAAVGQQEEVLRMQLEQQRLLERRADWQAERREVAARLNALLARPGDAAIERVTELPEVDWPAAVDGTRAPSLRQAQAMLSASERRTELARVEARPTWNAGVGFFNRGGLDSVVTLRVGLNLPVWHDRKQAREIEAAQHDAAAADANVRAMQREIGTQLSILQARFEAAHTNAQRYREGLLPLSSAALDAARSAYLSGRGDFAAVLNNWRSWWDARSGLARRQADRFIAWASCLALQGEDQP